MDSGRLVLWSSKTQASPRFQHRCNTDRPGLGVGRPLLPPVCPREGLTSKESSVRQHTFTAERQLSLIKGGTKLMSATLWSSKVCQTTIHVYPELTTEGRELLGLSVGHDRSQRLLPVLQVTCLQDVMPVFHHHCTDQLQDQNTTS